MPEPRIEYTQRLEARLKTIAGKERVHLQLGYWKLATIVAGLVLAWASFARNLFSPYWLIAIVVFYVLLAVRHDRVIRARTHAETAAAFYRRGIARIEDRWPGTGETGERFRDTKHIYAEDLDLFGRGGLFELLSTARLPMGENRLANWLCVPSSKEAILERQGLLQSLRDNLDLREDLAVEGEDLRVKLNPETLEGWSEGPRILPAGAMRAVAALLAVFFLAALIYDFVASTHIPVLLVLVIEAGMLRWLRPRAQTVIGGLATNEEGLLLFAEILKRIEREQFTSPRLQGFSAELKRGAEPASRAIRKLALIVSWIDARESPLALLAELPLLYSVHVAFAAEAWRARWGKRMRGWIEIVGEMEALLSLAAYSYEHPADPYPEIAGRENSQALFEGEELGHPLIPAARCVRNSVRLDAKLRVLLVSGSNMSGKSTFLRTAGINAVLAMAGAPIRGKSLRLTPLSIGSRIRSTDSLQENRSSFYTEILQIRQVFELMKTGAPLLFLFDELLEGTNSNDRRAGAEGLIRALLNHGAIGVVTTHDLALTDLPHVLGDQVQNKHFQDYVEDGKMRFDYKLRDGVVAKSNAIELMRLIGLEL